MRMMKLAILFLPLALLCSATSFSSEADWEKQFDIASQSYDSGDYKAAITGFEEILSKGHSSSELLYNLGNSYYKSAFLGRAVWAYETALQINPRDKDIRQNLTKVRTSLISPQEPPKSQWLMELAKNKLSYLRTDEICYGFTICVAVICLLTLIKSFGMSQSGILRFLTVFTVVSLLIAAAAIYIRWTEVQYSKGILVDKEVYVRHGPSDSNVKAFLLNEGSKVVIEQESANWFFVRFGDSESGWVPKSSIVKVGY